MLIMYSPCWGTIGVPALLSDISELNPEVVIITDILQSHKTCSAEFKTQSNSATFLCRRTETDLDIS